MALNRIVGSVLAVASGAALALQARINAGFSAQSGDAIMTSLWSFGSGAVILLLGVSVPPFRAGLLRLFRALRSRKLPPYALLTGVIGATLVILQSLVVSHVGVALFIVAVIAGQTIGAVVFDHFGAARAPRRTLSLVRVVAAALAVVGVVIGFGGDFNAGRSWWLLALPAGYGVVSAWQLLANGLIRWAADSTFAATTANFVVGSLCLAAVFAVVPAHPLPDMGQINPWLLTGGVLGVALVVGLTRAVRSLGALALALHIIIGQLVAAVVLDLVVPVGVNSSQPGVIVSLVVVTCAAVLVALSGRRHAER